MRKKLKAAYTLIEQLYTGVQRVICATSYDNAVPTLIKDMLDAKPDAALEAALAECAREPIRVPGAIQPHGVLLAVAGDPLCIEQVSANCATALGMTADELLGKPLSWLLSP